MPDIEIDIAINEARWNSAINNIEQFTRKIINKALPDFLEKIETVDISIVLADDLFLQSLNKNYREKDEPTNVLSFPQTEKNEVETGLPICSLGDIIIALETIEREALEQNKTIKDHYAHMLVHGCLHLLHFDHQSDSESKIMEEHEIVILKTLGIKNPYEII